MAIRTVSRLTERGESARTLKDVFVQMLEEIGVDSVEALYADIPDALRLKGKMDLPEPFLSEYELARHVEEILAKGDGSHS